MTVPPLVPRGGTELDDENVLPEDGRMNHPLTAGADARLAAYAAALVQAEQTREPILPISEIDPAFTIEDAYAVQRTVLRDRLERGERVVGRKVGLTSDAMRRQLAVDQPDFGVITDGMVVANAGTLDGARLIAPRAEAEIAFRIGRDLPPSPSLEAIVSAIDGVLVAIEVIDSRIVDWRITLVDTVADNASSARIVCGEAVPATPELLASLPDLVVSMHRDGTEVSRGRGAAVLGHPVSAIFWLAGAIGAFGDSLRAGDIVLAGAVDVSVALTPGSDWTVRAAGFPAVTMTVTAGSEARA